MGLTPAYPPNLCAVPKQSKGKVNPRLQYFAASMGQKSMSHTQKRLQPLPLSLILTSKIDRLSSVSGALCVCVYVCVCVCARTHTHMFKKTNAWLVTQSCPTLCDPMDCSPSGSSVLGDSSGKNTGVGCHALPNPRIKPRSPTLQADSLPTEPQGNPKNPGVGSLSLLQGIFPTQESTGVSRIAGEFFTSRATKEAQEDK